MFRRSVWSLWKHKRLRVAFDGNELLNISFENLRLRMQLGYRKSEYRFEPKFGGRFEVFIDNWRIL